MCYKCYGNAWFVMFIIYVWQTSGIRAAERIFSWGGGKDKKRHYNVKKGTNDAHTDNITNVLMEAPL